MYDVRHNYVLAILKTQVANVKSRLCQTFRKFGFASQNRRTSGRKQDPLRSGH